MPQQSLVLRSIISGVKNWDWQQQRPMSMNVHILKTVLTVTSHTSNKMIYIASSLGTMTSPTASFCPSLQYKKWLPSYGVGIKSSQKAVVLTHDSRVIITGTFCLAFWYFSMQGSGPNWNVVTALYQQPAWSSLALQKSACKVGVSSSVVAKFLCVLKSRHTVFSAIRSYRLVQSRNTIALMGCRGKDWDRHKTPRTKFSAQKRLICPQG